MKTINPIFENYRIATYKILKTLKMELDEFTVAIISKWSKMTITGQTERPMTVTTKGGDQWSPILQTMNSQPHSTLPKALIWSLIQSLFMNLHQIILIATVCPNFFLLTTL